MNDPNDVGDDSGVGASPPDDSVADNPPEPQYDAKAYRRPQEAPGDLASLLRLCHVPRWSVVPMLRPQSVAEHSYRVAAITMHLMKETGALSELAISVAEAMIHEHEEAITGDIPSPQKKQGAADVDRDPESPASRGDYIIKLADLLEAFSYLGNHGLNTRRRQEILDNYRESLMGHTEEMRSKFTWGHVDLIKLVDETLAILREEM